MADNSVLVFTPSARRAQAERGSAKAYERKTSAGFPDRATPELAEFLTGIDTAFLGTVSEAGAPYIQHRGGPKGFIKVVDEKTLGFADYRGNRQLLSTGNVAINERVSLFLMDYPRRERLKILGYARVTEASPELVEQLAEPDARPSVERVFFIDVVSFDWNCPNISPLDTARRKSKMS